ncbi:hypothetical protein V6B14_08505 [Sporosarcina psychrophila]|uniref:hypothetical protein n=1 Tax=Sporosarcina psychrophila TaxID=1476 RepID=UPI0030CD9446
MPDRLRKVVQQQLVISKGFSNQLAAIGEIASRANVIVARSMETFSAKMQSLVIPHIDLPQMAQSWENLRQGILETEEDIKVFKVAMVEMGYPPHDGMSIKQMRTISKRYHVDSNEVKQNIGGIMAELYDPVEMKEIILKWEKTITIKKRLPLLRNAIMAHNLGMYDLVVPAVLSQLEGVLVDTFSIKGRVTGEIQRVLLKHLLLKSKHFESTFNFDAAIHDYYKDNILMGFKHGEASKSDISRHAILHGGDTNFGRQPISLKALLLFDYIVTASEGIEDADIQNAKREVLGVRRRNSKRK